VSDRRADTDLGVNAETALATFPMPERDWEQDARAIEARIGAARERTDDALLHAPLPPEPGEPTVFSAVSTPLTHSGVRTQSLAEIARRSVQQKQAAEREMARASFALAAQARPSAEQAAALREAVSSVRTAEAPAPPSRSAPRAEIATIAARPGQSPWSKVSLGVGLLALAAAATLWLRKPEQSPELVAATAAPNTAAATNQPRAIAAEPSPAPAPAPRAIDPSSLSSETAATKVAPESAREKSAVALAAPERPAASTPAASGPRPANIVLEDDQPSAPVAAADKPPEKTLPPDPALRPAESTGGAMPVKPSTGAVQAALGAVMSGARHCVAGDEAPSSAVVVFGSDGRVQTVTVSGPAAGKPSGACIQSQLSRARVQPFAAATFSINATVRPD